MLFLTIIDFPIAIERFNSASEIPEYRLPWKAVRWEIEQLVEHGRGGVHLEYGRRLFSPMINDGRTGDFVLQVSLVVQVHESTLSKLT